METVIKLVQGFIAIVICSYLFTLFMWLAHKESEKQNYHQEQIQKPYYEEPFRIKTYREEFDSLGIEIIFWTGTESQLMDTLKLLGIKIPFLPKTREQFDSLYPEVLPCYWNPKFFILYSDGYFIWGGNRMTVFETTRRNYPTCKFVLIGDILGNIFLTQEMYIFVF